MLTTTAPTPVVTRDCVVVTTDGTHEGFLSQEDLPDGWLMVSPEQAAEHAARRKLADLLREAELLGVSPEELLDLRDQGSLYSSSWD